MPNKYKDYEDIVREQYGDYIRHVDGREVIALRITSTAGTNFKECVATLYPAHVPLPEGAQLNWLTTVGQWAWDNQYPKLLNARQVPRLVTAAA
jgi:hypothetical protein